MSHIKDSWVRTIDVSSPVLHKKGYTLYKVTSKVFPKDSVEAVTEVTVWKRYNDFKKLHKSLSTLHQNLYLKDTFPPFAKTRFFGRYDPEVIEERRTSALHLLQFAANSSPLFTSQVFVKFFEGGHLVEEDINKVKQEIKENLLQPQKCLRPSDITDFPFCKNEDNSLHPQENGSSEAVSPLGGIWQHHQVPDAISLASDDDDRTTFTDDDSVASRPSLSLSEFDPLFQSDVEQESSLTSPDYLCNSWLLSALQTCNISTAEREESSLEFPRPFGDFEATEEYHAPFKEVKKSNEIISDIQDSHFPFDVPTPAGEQPIDASEFDPLRNKKDSVEEDDTYDNFAMTPNSYTKDSKSRPAYIVQASEHVLAAEVAERTGKHMEAFESYKKAIDILLQGFQRDKCDEMKDAVRKKVLLYLMRAEELYETKLPKETESLKPKIIAHSSISLSRANIVSNLQGSVRELNKYKVLGVLDKVLLVLDVSNSNTYIVKTLYKSPSPRKFAPAQIVPQNVPFVVKLYRIYETNYSLFLILEHASGGRLWDYVSSFLQRTPLTPCNDGTCFYVESKNRLERCNVYSGKKICEEGSLDATVTAADSDLMAAENCPSSYVALFKKYADSVVKEENVSLAKYKMQKRPSRDDLSTQKCRPKNFRNRRSSSTGSLDASVSQKTCLLEAFIAMDDTASQKLPKTLLPESCVCMWAAEIVIALEALHNLGIICIDLHPKNILLGTEGHILLSYQSQWNNVDFVISEAAMRSLFCAPEVGNIFPVTSDCDWWSLGAILFELLTGHSLLSCHPTGITCHTILNFPTEISPDAKDIVTKFLQVNPTERLGSGIYGVEEIKCHPFFCSVKWDSVHK